MIQQGQLTEARALWGQEFVANACCAGDQGAKIYGEYRSVTIFYHTFSNELNMVVVAVHKKLGKQLVRGR